MLLCDGRGPGTNVVEIMNALAAHGYESVSTVMAGGPAGGASGAAGDAGDAGDDEGLVGDVMALVDRLGERGWLPEQIGVLGYGVGGRAAFVAAAECELGAAISISPTGVTRSTSLAAPGLGGLARAVRTPWLGLVGGRDWDQPASALRELDAALRAGSPVYTEIVTYPGLDAEFYNDAGDSAAHAASFDTWQRAVEWLNKRVVPRLTPLADAWLARQRDGATT